MDLPSPCTRCEDDENSAYRFKHMQGGKALRAYGGTGGNECRPWIWIIAAFLLGLILGYFAIPALMKHFKADNPAPE